MTTAPSPLAGPQPAMTPWLAGALRPVRAGVYRRAAPAGPFACWDGRRWRRDATSAAAAAQETGPSPIQDGVRWRGLAVASSRPCATCGGSTVIDHGLVAGAEVDRIDECPDC
ncbi:MAG: hypothetical protein M3Z16_09990 [Pseudomonadota bacterium]|nr:hypothetical protein [Pseudomonadota bacterium]